MPYLYDGDTFDHKGYTFRVNFERDEYAGEPWKECDGHGIVSEWTTRDKKPGERILCEDRRSKRFYDVRETLKIARRDGWGTRDGRREGESAKAYAARAVQADFEYLRGWCIDEWRYLGVIVTLLDDDDNATDYRESLWGVESLDREYLVTVAHELADEIHSRIEVSDPDVQLGEN